MAEQSLVWKGQALTERMRAAQREGVNKTMADCVKRSRTIHEWDDQTGRLTRSIKIVLFAYPAGNGVRGTWGSTDVNYALMQEIGGTIRPKRAKFLAVPISEEAKRAGSPRNLPNLVYVQSVRGQPMLVNENTGRVHYLLKKSVTIPARPYLRPSADEIYPQLARNIRAAYQEAGWDWGYARAGGS